MEPHINLKDLLRLADPMLTIANTGSIAEAALQLNSMFQAAQAACDQYIYNVQLRCRQAEENAHNNYRQIGNESEY